MGRDCYPGPCSFTMCRGCQPGPCSFPNCTGDESGLNCGNCGLEFCSSHFDRSSTLCFGCGYDEILKRRLTQVRTFLINNNISTTGVPASVLFDTYMRTGICFIESSPLKYSQKWNIYVCWSQIAHRTFSGGF